MQSTALHLDETADRMPDSKVGTHKTMEASKSLKAFPSHNLEKRKGQPLAEQTAGSRRKIQVCTDPSTDTAVAVVDLLEGSKLQREFEA